MSTDKLYQEAYDEQYSRKDYVAACRKYIMVMDQFPGSAESASAQAQLDGIEQKFREEQPGPSPEGTACLELIAQMKEARLLKARQEEEAHARALSLFENAINVDDLFYVDQEQRIWAAAEKTQTGKVMINKVYSFDDLVDFEVVEDKTSVSGENAPVSLMDVLLFGVKDAAIGAALYQADSISDLYINLTVKDFQDPAVRITMIDSETAKDSEEYKRAVSVCERIVSLLHLIKEGVVW